LQYFFTNLLDLLTPQWFSFWGQALASRCLKAKFLWPWPRRFRPWPRRPSPWPRRSRPWP